VAYEAMAWGRHIHDYRDSREVVRRAAHPNVGLVLDTFHIFSRQTELGCKRTTSSLIRTATVTSISCIPNPAVKRSSLSWCSVKGTKGWVRRMLLCASPRSSTWKRKLTAALKMPLFDPDRLRAENTDCIASEQIDPHVTPLRTHYIEQLVTPSVHSMP